MLLSKQWLSWWLWLWWWWWWWLVVVAVAVVKSAATLKAVALKM